MPEPPSLQVSGTVQARDGGVLLVLDSRLEGHDTFLAGQLDLDDGPSLSVRIITLDEMTVLRPAGPGSSASRTMVGCSAAAPRATPGRHSR